MDETDYKILNLLKEDSSLSTYKISKKASIPQTTVLNRIRKLNENGIIKKYSIVVDQKKVGNNVSALIFVKVENTEEKKHLGQIGLIEERISKHPMVSSVKRLMGNFDFVIELFCKDIDELNDFLIKNVRSVHYVKDTNTMVVL